MNLWETETPITSIEGLNLDVPPWIEGDISPYDVASIRQGGCASGAYMPAVTYSRAAAIMAAQGDDVLQYLQDNMGELPRPPDDSSWSGLACFYLSAAVELWASGAESVLEDFESETEDSP